MLTFANKSMQSAAEADRNIFSFAGIWPFIKVLDKYIIQPDENF